MSIPGSAAKHRAQAVARTSTGLERYSGAWNSRTAAHLLRRATFGAALSDVPAATSGSLDDILARLFADQPNPLLPVDPATGQTWIGKPFDSTHDGAYANYLKSWWMGLIVTQGISIREKMVLFWHNHFVSEYQTVLDSRLMFNQNALFRQYALGNVKALVKAVTVDPAMLVYLNGYRNSGNGSNIPDENYARELQELFTIGKGPEAGPGNYTNYTEQDVKAAARVLTGWRINGYRDAQNATISSYFDPTRHDTKDKDFSAAYRNTRITGSTDGTRELNDLVEMIFQQQETARFLCRKLYRWFVYYDIDLVVEDRVIGPMADILRGADYELKPALDALLRSAHFFDDANIGCMIKSPADLLAGAIRTLQIALPAPDSQTAVYYAFMSYLKDTASNLQMSLLEPPNVAGWPAYYQVPAFHRLWINTITLPTRWAYTDALVNGIRSGTARVAADSLSLTRLVSNPGDPQILVAELGGLLFPIDLSAGQRENLVDVLIPGLPDYEWTIYWNSYTSDPNNAQKRNAVTTRLNALLKFMLRLAEFELS